MYVNSGYRCPALNAVVGGAKRSYHLLGRAADLTTGSRADNRRLYDILRTLPHHELIWERGGLWIHVAW
ncbi:D-Ala-D-Ala carboxypeptidase family metallohydrolase [uncultured Muribaculum sp.]|uniref:D-Ala-D-Ala carboxypeptidase family metallohydrolase n=1 Tax=uncultured Muribaculum sp. TaxID=1918613 RepID=UPI00343C0C8B